MNLQAIANGAIIAVNSQIPATLQMSTGYMTGANGKQSPMYNAPQSLLIQVQAASGATLAHLAALNIQGVNRVAYLAGDWSGLVRPNKQGGDLITFNGQTWLIVQVLETWPDWSRVAIVLQAGS